jgi:sec-independent protein translocase protein TatB
MNLGMSEMIFIFIAALILVGPKKLPEIMRQVGKWMAEFKRASNEFKWQIETEMRNMELEAERSKQTVLPPVAPPQGTIASGAVLESEPKREPQPALTAGSDETPAEAAPVSVTPVSVTPDSAKSADA